MALHPIGEQESTDLEKCLYSVEAPLFLGLGFLGGRIDHHLAAMSALVKNHAKPVVLLGGGELCFLCPPQFELDLAACTRLSLFPMGRCAAWSRRGCSGRSPGWLSPEGRIRTSNLALGGRVRLRFDAPRMLVILPEALLGQVVERFWGEDSERVNLWASRPLLAT